MIDPLPAEPMGGEGGASEASVVKESREVKEETPLLLPWSEGTINDELGVREVSVSDVVLEEVGVFRVLVMMASTRYWKTNKKEKMVSVKNLYSN